VIDLAGQHPTELRRAQPLLEVGDLRRHLLDYRVVLLGDAELEELLRVVDVPCQLLGRLDLLLDVRALTRDLLGLLRIVPKPGSKRLFVETFDLLLQFRDVKDAPLAS
jgi:hypothetical protein